MLEPRHTVTKLVPSRKVHSLDSTKEVVIAEGSKEAMEAVRRLMKLPDGPNVPK
jgi:hypothetical protein